MRVRVARWNLLGSQSVAVFLAHGPVANRNRREEVRDFRRPLSGWMSVGARAGDCARSVAVASLMNFGSATSLGQRRLQTRPSNER